MLRSNSKSLGNHVVSPEEEKGGAAVGKICRKGRFQAWNEIESGGWKTNNNKYDC